MDLIPSLGEATFKIYVKLLYLCQVKQNPPKMIGIVYVTLVTCDPTDFHCKTKWNTASTNTDHFSKSEKNELKLQIIN